MTEREILDATREEDKKYPGYRAYACAATNALFSAALMTGDPQVDSGMIEKRCHYASMIARRMCELEAKING